MIRRPAVARILLTGLVGLAVAACYPNSPSPAGQQMHTVYDVFFVGGVITVIVVWVLLAWVVLRYRRRDDRLPPQVTGHLGVEVAWVVIPAVVLAGLFGLTLQTMMTLPLNEPAAGVRLHIWGFRWQWRFDYSDLGISVVGTPSTQPELVVPVGTPIHITLDSADVAHSFYVPLFLFKRDAIPGFTNHFDFTVDAPGTYGGQCAEFCGTFHDAMNFSVRAIPASEFQAWVQQQPRAPLPTPPSLVGDAPRGDDA